MRLSAPREITFVIAVIVAVIGLIGSLFTIPVLSGFAVWLVVIGFVILAIGTLMEGI